MPRAGERGALISRTGSIISLALVYPNSYAVGMANLGFQFLYNHINSLPNLSCERFFVEAGQPGKNAPSAPFSEETGRPLSHFPIIAFSIPFESDYPNIVKALISSSIPLFQEERAARDPFVMAGGVSVSMNPEPMADFMDLIYVGEIAENIKIQGSKFGSFLSRLAELVIELGPGQREDIYLHMKEFPGVYIPSAHTVHYNDRNLIQKIDTRAGFPEITRAVKRRSIHDPVPVSTLFSSEAEFGESTLIETNRGCSRGCKFCAAGWIHFPVRHRKFESFKTAIDSAIDQGLKVGLVGSDLAGRPDLEEVLSYIIESRGEFSLSSIRPEGLTPRVMELMAATGQKTATLAPEVASGRLKRVIGKEIPSERFIELIRDLVCAGIPNVRLYFMMGLPTETDEDFKTIIDFTLEARAVFVEASRPKGRIGKLSVQINPFVPKPWTPFQWSAMATPAQLSERARIARNALKKTPNLKLRIESIREAVTQALLSRGDRRVSRVMVRTLSGENWNQALKAQGLTADLYNTRERRFEEILPWDVTYHGVPKERLWKAWKSALDSGETP